MAYKIKLSEIHPNIKNPRKGLYDALEMQELKDNLLLNGQLTPIKIDENNIILAGHRRYQAMTELGWEDCMVDKFKGLSDFNKTCIMISDNATQKTFNPWDVRYAINDIYWNEFCENYTFKSSTDKGYSEFSKLIGVSTPTIKRIIESMAKSSQDIIDKAKKEGLSSETFQAILSAPKKHRKVILNKAIELNKHKRKEISIRDSLRTYKKRLVAEESKEELNPRFWKTVFSRLDALDIVIDSDVIAKASIDDKIELANRLKRYAKIYESLSREIARR